MSGVPFAGFVLAGGMSRRMGRDKAFVRIDGRPLVVGAADALAAAGATHVTVVGGDAAALAGLGLGVIADAAPGEGPLAGLVTALRIARDVPALVVSCDLADPSAANMIELLEALGTGVDVATPSWKGRRQWLHSAWGPRCGDVLAARFAAGERAVAAALGGLRVLDVAVPEPERLRDVDTPEDLATILREREEGR